KQAKGLNVAGYLTKPVSQSSLYDAIVRLIGSGMENDTVRSSRMEKDYQLAGLKVLLAEDNEINQQVAAELLSSQGITVDIVWNGSQEDGSCYSGYCHDCTDYGRRKGSMF
ncbi:MAG TPA: hypothetical protein PLU43_04565, partial [Lachnospiraceae bacterium]|nr:hypothetical protein [Lachnospiraceae bacterium]